MWVKDAVDFSQLRRVLVIKLRHHGDVLLTSPVFTVLKNHYPHLELDALVYDDTRDMLEGHPGIDRLHMTPRHGRRSTLAERWRRERQLLRELRERRYDVIIHLTDHGRGVWLTRLLRPRYAITYNAPAGPLRWRRGAFSHLVPVAGPRRHTVEKHLDVLRRVGLQPAADERKLVLVPGERAEHRIDQILHERGLADKTFIHIHPTSRWFFKCWPPEQFARLIDRLANAGHTIVLTAAPSADELELIDRINAQIQAQVVDLSGQLSLKELAALTARAKLFIGVDSAPMHMAAAMQTPVVALFGPSGDQEWGPWQVAARVITSDHPCRPCGLDGCGGGKVSECLTRLPAERVFRAAETLAPP